MILRSLGWAATALAVLAALGIATTRPFGYDLVAYLGAARRLVAGEPLYPIAESETIYLGVGEYLYPPTSALGFIPFALLPQEAATVVWTLVLVAVAAAIAGELVRPLDPAVRPWALAGYALYLPLIAEITLGNLNLLTLGLCLLAWRWRARQTLGGTSLAAAVGSKLLPVALPLFFLAAGAWRTVAAFGAVGTAIVLLTLPWLHDAWQTYARLLVQLAGAPGAQAITLVPDALGPSRVLLPLAAAAVALIAGRLARVPGRATRAYATALAALPLAAPGIWYPYLVFALPLLASVLRTAGRGGTLGVIAAYAALEIPKRPGGPDVAFIGLLLLIAMGLAGSLGREPARPRGAAASAGPAA